MALETDYLVVGAGVSGLAFADALVASSDADVLLVDQRARVGGHWNDAYPFVRLHIPSAYYGVTSTPLGEDRVVADGPDAGLYEMATGAEVLAYLHGVLDDVLLPTGRVRFVGGHRAEGTRLVDVGTGEQTDVVVRRKVVDARYLENTVPSRHTPSFPVADGMRLVTPNALPDALGTAQRYVVLGSGKTAIDACLWLLDHGVDAGSLRWVRPRDQWLLDRAGWQPLDQVAGMMDGLALELEALAGATSTADLFARLEASGRLLRIDRDVEPTMYRCATVSAHELEQLRRVTDVVRLGRVRRVDRDALVLDRGQVDASPDDVLVDCTAVGLPSRPPLPVFEDGRITLQQVRSCAPPFNAALLGHLEATRDDDAEKNRLAPVNPYLERPEDWLTGFATTMRAARLWGADPELADWVERCRLNLLRGVLDHAGEPLMASALERFGAHAGPGMRRLAELLAEVPSQRGTRVPAS